jgi:hypothetical protein
VHETVLVKQVGILIDGNKRATSGSAVGKASSINVGDNVEVTIAEEIEADVLATARAAGI